MAVTSEGQLYTWGKGEFGRLGTGESGNSQVKQNI